MEQEEHIVKGIRFELDYSYLRSTDFSWLFGRLRGELIVLLAEQFEFSRRGLRGVRLPFEIREVRTERSIVIDLFPLLGLEAWAWDSFVRIGETVLAALILWWLRRRERTRGHMDPFGKGRYNLKRITTRSIERVTLSEAGVERQFTRESEVSHEVIEWRPRRR